MFEQGGESLTETALRAALGAACLGFVLGLVAAGPFGSPATDFDQADVDQASRIVIGVALVPAGVALALIGRSQRAAGLLAAFAGVAWLAIVPARSVSSSDLLRGPGQAVAMLAAPALLMLVVALAPPGRAARRPVLSAAILVAIAMLVAALRLAAYDPFADPTCVSCGHGAQPLLVATAGQRILLNRAAAALAIACAAGVLVLHAGQLTGGGRTRGGMLAVVAGTVLLALALAAGAATQLTSAAPVAAPEEALADVIELAGAIGGGLLALGLVWLVVDVLRLRLRMRQLARDVASATDLGRLEVRLANALDDRSVVVGYWYQDEAGWVSATGMPVEGPPADAGRGQLTIERGGQPIAAIWHRRDIEPQAIKRELTPSFIVALDNERLQAVGMANLRVLRASRARLVSVQEAQRQQVERDLHDGLQQRLLAIVFDLRLARVAAERLGERARSRWLEQAEAMALAIVEDVRRLARGIYPAILGQAGLAAALSSLADEAPIPMAVSVAPMPRLAQALETTVYQVIADALGDAVRDGAAELSVSVERVADEIAVVIDHDGSTAPVRVRLADRVAAAGGSLAHETSADDAPRRLRIALPCG